MEDLITELKARVAERGSQNHRPAAPDDLRRAKESGFPDELLDFYAKCEPASSFELGLRIWSIDDAIVENTGAVPGLALSPHGYIVFASTFCGDAYCIDTNTASEDGLHPVLLFSHESIDEDATKEEIEAQRKVVATSFEDFLRKFLDDAVSEEPNYG